MELKGTIANVLEIQSGQGKNGEWKKQDYVVDYNLETEYPKKMMFNLWGDKIDQCNIKGGDSVVVSFDIDCREYNGRWYNDVKAWKVETLEQAQEPFVQNQGPIENPEFATTEKADDLPF